MRVLALDIGMKTIGVAVSDELRMAANPVCTIARKGTEPDVDSVLALAKEHAVVEIVAGLPLTLEGERGARARRRSTSTAAARPPAAPRATRRRRSTRARTPGAYLLLLFHASSQVFELVKNL